MDGMLEAFSRTAQRLAFHPPRIPIVSNLTGQLATARELCSPDSWVRHARRTVRFLDGVRTAAQSVSTFLELGPHGVLSALGQDALAEDAAARTSFIPALRRGHSELDAFSLALGALHVRGRQVDWPTWFAPLGPRRVELPTYAFQRDRFWLDAPRTRHADATSAHGADDPAAPPSQDHFWAAIERGELEKLHQLPKLHSDEQRSSLAALLPALAAWWSSGRASAGEAPLSSTQRRAGDAVARSPGCDLDGGV